MKRSTDGSIKRSKFFDDLGMKWSLPSNLAACIDVIFTKGIMTLRDLDESIFDIVRTLSTSTLETAIAEFLESDFSSVSDKKSHLLTILTTHKDATTDSNIDSTNVTIKKLNPDDANISDKVKSLLARKKYKLDVLPGQRHFHPAENWEGIAPTHNTEVFVGKLPRDVFEDELVPLLENIGPVYSLRLMMDPSAGLNKGYAFAVYKKSDCQKAVDTLQDRAIRPGKTIKLNLSCPSTRLFVGSIPKNKSKDELYTEFSNHSENLKEVIIYADPNQIVANPNKHQNRGFCFLEYETHLDAANAKRKFSHSSFLLFFNSQIFVDWADPQEDPDEDVMQKVKVLFVKNLTSDVTEEDVQDKFATFGSLEKVKRLRDYAFIHFDNREDALKALEAMNGSTELGQTSISVTLAKPVSDSTKQRRNQRKMQFDPQQNPWQDQYATPQHSSFSGFGYSGEGNTFRPSIGYKVPRGNVGRGRSFRGATNSVFSPRRGFSHSATRPAWLTSTTAMSTGAPRPLMGTTLRGRGRARGAPTPLMNAGGFALSAQGGTKRGAGMPAIGAVNKRPRQDDWGSAPIAQQPLR